MEIINLDSNIQKSISTTSDLLITFQDESFFDILVEGASYFIKSITLNSNLYVEEI